MFRRDSKAENIVVIPKIYTLTPPKNKVCPGIASKKLPALPIKKSGERGKSHMTSITLSVQEAERDNNEEMYTMYAQGAVEIHLARISLSTKASRYMQQKLANGGVYKLRWNFYIFNTSMTDYYKFEEGTMDLGLTYFYKVNLDDAFLTYANNRAVDFELIGNNLSKEVYLGKGKLNLMHILDEPNEKYTADLGVVKRNMRTTRRKYVISIRVFDNLTYVGWNDILSSLALHIDLEDSDEAELLSNTAAIKYYGSLSVWIRLVCYEHHVNSLKLRTAPTSIHSRKERKKSFGKTRVSHFLKTNQSIRASERIDNLTSTSYIRSSESSSSSSGTDSDIESFQEALDLVLTRNKALRITQSEIAAELKERSKWLHEEYNWKRTLQEFSILKGDDPHAVRWRQWRDNKTSSVKLRRYYSLEELYENKITISIHFIEFYRFVTDWMAFPKIDLLYIELKFLSFEGDEMMTKSLPIDKNEIVNILEFNYSKKFSIDPKNNEKICKELAESVRNKNCMRFVIMSEPFEDLTKVQCSFEIGHCEISIFDLVQLVENNTTQEVVIKKDNGEDEILGRLTVTIDGIQAMRTVAIQILAPPDMKVSTSSTNLSRHSFFTENI